MDSRDGRRASGPDAHHGSGAAAGLAAERQALRSSSLIDQQSLGGAIKEAFTHPSYLLLVTGFFVCGFHVAFYGVHLPAFVADKGLDASVGVAALTTVGLGQFGRHLYRRAIGPVHREAAGPEPDLFRALLRVPWPAVPADHAVTVIALSAVLGLLWLSTVPLTSSLVATFFGTRWMSMLFGVVFLSHQVGSFTGLWLAGILYDPPSLMI